MKTQNKKDLLKFNQNNIIDLNSSELNSINGGTTPIVGATIVTYVAIATYVHENYHQ